MTASRTQPSEPDRADQGRSDAEPSAVERARLDADWAVGFMRLGRPQPPYPAFPDMHPDDVVFSHSAVKITAGDVRQLQAFLQGAGAERADRLAEIMRLWRRLYTLQTALRRGDMIAQGEVAWGTGEKSTNAPRARS